jgi:hypothetical protein
MTAQEPLWEAQHVLEKCWKEDQPPEQTQLLSFARDALGFISATGQRYRFHAYRKPPTSRSPLNLESWRKITPSTQELLRRTEGFFLGLLSTPRPSDEAELIQVIVDALHFIAETEQQGGLEEYIKHLDAGAPPYAVAAFDTAEEAETWLENHPDPPDFAHVIVANEYRTVHHDRQSNTRQLPNDNAIEYYLAELREEDPPVAAAAFNTRADAVAWLRAQPDPPRRTWVLAGGEFYLAAYYPNINHRALFPLSMAIGHATEV